MIFYILRRNILFMSIEVGSKLQGKVTGITKFGAFVELPEGSTGLVHISEVADNYVKDINDHLKVGDQVEVKVINVEKDGKIGLSIKKAKDRPEGQKPIHTQIRIHNVLVRAEQTIVILLNRKTLNRKWRNF